MVCCRTFGIRALSSQLGNTKALEVTHDHEPSRTCVSYKFLKIITLNFFKRKIFKTFKKSIFKEKKIKSTKTY